MKDLKKMKLSIPTLDSSECKTLMGGDGYGYDVIGGDLQECVITADGYRPDHSDYDYQDDILDDEQNDYGYEHSGDQDNDREGFNINNMLKNAQPQVGNCCVFAGIYAMLCGYGQVSPLGWLGIAASYANSNNIDLNSIIDGSFDGVSSGDMPELLGQYFDGVSPIDMGSLSEALNDGPVYGVINPGDVDKDGIENDGHAVIITDFDEEHGTIYYWDPETGESGNGAVGDYIQGWSVNGVKK